MWSGGRRAPPHKSLWVGKGHTYETLKEFFDSLSEQQKGSIWVIAMDMWDPYIKAVSECFSHVRIVFDQLHAVAASNRMINKVRNSEYRKVTETRKEVIKGNK